MAGPLPTPAACSCISSPARCWCGAGRRRRSAWWECQRRRQSGTRGRRGSLSSTPRSAALPWGEGPRLPGIHSFSRKRRKLSNIRAKSMFVAKRGCPGVNTAFLQSSLGAKSNSQYAIQLATNIQTETCFCVAPPFSLRNHRTVKSKKKLLQNFAAPSLRPAPPPCAVPATSPLPPLPSPTARALPAGAALIVAPPGGPPQPRRAGPPRPPRALRPPLRPAAGRRRRGQRRRRGGAARGCRQVRHCALRGPTPRDTQPRLWLCVRSRCFGVMFVFTFFFN